MKKIKLIIVSIIFAFNAVSQDVADTTLLDEMVVTASKVLQPKGLITQKIDVITQDDILGRISENRNIADVLKNQAGASVSVLSRNDANWGTFGGIGPKYSTFMLNGLPIDAFVDPMTLDLMAVERIEVQRGPASVMYSNYLSQDFAGNQSPLAGTVNMILKERFEKPATAFLTSFGSYNTYTSQLYHQNSYGNTHYFTGLSYERSDYTDYGIENSWLNMQKNPEYQKTKLYGGLSWFSDDDRQKFSLFANRTMHNGDAGRLYRGFDHNYNLINAGYSMKLTNQLTLQAGIGYRNYDRSWQESNFNIVDSLLSNNGVVQNIVPADVSVSYIHGRGHLLTAGIDYQGADYYTWGDPLVGYKSYGNKSTAMQTGVYVQEELRFDKLIVRAGLRFNYTKNNIAFLNNWAPIQSTKEWDKLLYSGGLKYNATEYLSVFANVGTSFMTPGLRSVGGTIQANDTVNSGQIPNPDLLPEAGLGIDAGIELRLPYNISFSARGFMLSVEDAIVENVVSQNPSQTMSVNAGETSSTGAEVEIKHSIGNSLEWFANATYMKTEVKNPHDPDQDGATVPFAPELIANAGISYTAPFGLSITPIVNYNDGFYDSSSKSGRNFFKPGLVLNAHIAMNIYEKNNNNVTCFVNLYNITDNQYELPWQFKDTGFSVTGGLRVNF